MLEKDLNRIIRNAFSWGYKIPDPPQAQAVTASKRPFDGFARFDDKPVYWESKFEKSLKSFNLKRIDTHQREALDQMTYIKDALVLVPYGCHVARGDTRVYIFDWRQLKERSTNVLKKQLETLPYHSVKKGAIEFDPEKIIHLGEDA